MNENDKLAICYNALTLFGFENQIDMAIEEMSELTSALLHYKRHREHNVEEEMADVQIMMKQLEIIFDADKVAKIKNDKLLRLKERVENAKQC